MTPLLYSPGTSFRYQSMGILLAAEIVERISGMPLREFEHKEIFEPLGTHSSLGLGKTKIGDTSKSRNPANRIGMGTASTGGIWVIHGAVCIRPLSISPSCSRRF